MKKYLLLFLLSANGFNAIGQKDTLTLKKGDTLLLDNIEVMAIRADDKMPFAKTNLSRKQIQANNLGYDLPFLLELTPSVVAHSDAGNGVGYTNLSIRGTDATRINVTLNGIPFNDAESQGTFFVDMPDIGSSAGSVQIQRGVGTSSNGAGAFGATINLSTNEVNTKRYLELNNNYGSFNTWKNTIRAGSGLFKKHFTLDARLSRISSDGYIERAASNLKSGLISAAYLSERNSLRFNFITGSEITYQAWNGVPEEMLKTNRRYNAAGTDKPGSPYADENDNYVQSHYQLFWNHKMHHNLSWSIAGFLTRGKGYYENYKGSQKYSKYFLPDYYDGSQVVKKTDMIIRAWLDNYFYGSVFSLQYEKGKTRFTFGGAGTFYDGGHYSDIIWAQQGVPDNYRYYNAPAFKKDFNLYAKWMQSFGNGFTTFLDLQQRMADYEINGYKGHPDIYVHKKYTFLNPKAGISFFKNGYQAYASFSVAAKEPNRDDFEAGASQIPRPERLLDWESGFSVTKKKWMAGVNFYYMDYRDQLVNTGKINDVGAYTRTNADKSFRAGAELQAGIRLLTWLEISGNATLSANKIKSFTEYVDDYDNGGQIQNQYTNTDISFSPNTIASGVVQIRPFRHAEIRLISKYVGSQYLDNTSQADRMLKSYFVQHARVGYTFAGSIFKEAELMCQVNNIFNSMYEPNGYSFNYISGGKLVVENYYFPMAGTNFMLGLNVKF
ncbi:MAG: TonB-dependent receptor plug domain-containing protein [Chitinophagaceae bacterium]|nr:TonB-dependent receptor plug domain-containing protein [Chitinophagaceae bacterium]